MIKLFGGTRREDGQYTISMAVDPSHANVKTNLDKVLVEGIIKGYMIDMSEWEDGSDEEFLSYLIDELFNRFIDLVIVKKFVEDAKYEVEKAVEQDGHKGFIFLYLWKAGV